MKHSDQSLEKQYEPFAGFTLEDFIRHLANWPSDPDSGDLLLLTILSNCRQWVEVREKWNSVLKD